MLVVLLAAGSGIAPLKACIESGQLLGLASSSFPQVNNTTIALYYGEWTANDLCFTELYQEWKDTYGVTVRTVLSRSHDNNDDDDDDRPRPCYVQDVLSADLAKIYHKDDTRRQRPQQPLEQNNATPVQPPQTVYAILCGMDDMIESCTQVLMDYGVPENHILLNI